LETPESATIRIADLAATLRREGADVLDFSAGRAVEDSPRDICQAAVDALMGGDTHQTMARGTPEFRQACALKLERENGIVLDPDREIVATMGCKHGLMLSLLAAVNPGEEVIVEDPCFVSYQAAIRYAGAVPVAVPLRRENRFRWAPDELEAAVGDRTAAILYCSPHNPTGAVHDTEDLEAIAEVARRHKLVVIADETYERLTWGDHVHRSLALLDGMGERTIGLMGVTKAFSMGGWRIGFAYAHEQTVSSMMVLQAHINTCAGSFAQAGGARALGDEPPGEVRALWADWQARIEFVVGAADAMPMTHCVMPEGGFYAWIDVSELGTPSVELAERLLRDQHIALVPGSAFGSSGEGYLRMTCVKSWDDIRAGIARLEEGLTS
jgi:aspartate/methionine/tyrosine aminotransferase